MCIKLNDCSICMCKSCNYLTTQIVHATKVIMNLENCFKNLTLEKVWWQKISAQIEVSYKVNFVVVIAV